jgi:hypothetical protein
MGRDDHLVWFVLVDGVSDRLERIGIDDRAAGRDSGLVEEVERPAQTPLGARAPAVRINDEARSGLVLRGDDGDADRPLLRPLAQQLDEALAGNGFVGDDQNVARLGANARSPSLVRAARRDRRS